MLFSAFDGKATALFVSDRFGSAVGELNLIIEQESLM
jgi:hypothetical protein